MAAAPIQYMVCGCPVSSTPTEHARACWMAEAEAIAEEAAASAPVYDPPRHRTLAALTALADTGHLREVAGGEALFALLDQLTEIGLLGPSTVEAS